jgi:hypothetical protein
MIPRVGPTTPKSNDPRLLRAIRPKRRDRRECAIHRLDVRKFLELTGIPEGAIRRPN